MDSTDTDFPGETETAKQNFLSARSVQKSMLENISYSVTTRLYVAGREIRNRISRLKNILPISLLLSGEALAQQLNLFEELDSASRDRAAADISQTARDRDGNLITRPLFKLIGTSRIGSNYLLVLEDYMGEIISMSVPSNQIRSIPGHAGYEVSRIGSGEAFIRYPDETTCIEFQQDGVTCESAQVTRVSLTNQAPLESPVSARESMVAEGSAGEDAPINPFEALLERAANPNADSDTGSFEPIRIDPKDVPPGMKVVSTPFGDRLIEDDC